MLTEVILKLPGRKEEGMVTLPHYDEIHFVNPPVRQVICQVRFPSIVALAAEGALLAAFQEAIRERYPFLQQVQQISIAISPGESPVPRATTQNTWQFADANRRWAVTLAPDALTLETSKYSSFADLSDQMAIALTALVDHVRPGYYTRLGIRYVNEIPTAEQDTANWSKVLNTHWRAILDAGVIAGDVDHWLQNVRVQVQDGTFNINVGYLAQEPSRVVIDLDCFAEVQSELHVGEIMDRFTEWHDLIHNMFRWSISDDMLQTLERQ